MSRIEDADLQSVVRALDERFGLDALWLFGSEARGSAGDTSDVDLGALFSSRPSAEEVLSAREDLALALGRPIDLLDLDRASPIVGMQVVRTGRLIADLVPAHRLQFLMYLPSRYEDVRICLLYTSPSPRD